MKYLNGVLTVIASCLVLITFAVTGIIPSASAKDSPDKYISVPINPDGSITVRFAKGETMDVNIDEVGGTSQSGSTIEVNIEEVRGRNVNFSPLPVSVQR
jgi:hypothetical protein